MIWDHGSCRRVTSKKSDLAGVGGVVVAFNIGPGCIAMLALPAVLKSRDLAGPNEFTKAASNYEPADKLLADYRTVHLDWDKPSGEGGLCGV